VVRGGYFLRERDQSTKRAPAYIRNGAISMKISGQHDPKPPKQLSKEAKAWWRKIVASWELDDAALLLLESTLEQFDTMRKAQELITTQGLTYVDRFNQIKPNPATVIERDAKQGLLRGIRALGLDLEPLNSGPGRPPGR
jgi:P27 family predicted phage terminase small subunit